MNKHTRTAQRYLLGTALLLGACGGEGTPGSAAPSGPVRPGPVLTSLSVSLSAASVVTGKTVVATVTGSDQNGAPIATGPITWATSAPLTASVSSSGLVTALSPGTTQVSATAAAVTASAPLTVLPAPVSTVIVTLPSVNLTVGDSTQAIAKPLDESGTALAGRSTVWTSSNPAVASISSTGIVRAIAPGSVSISATVEAKVGEVALTVYPQSTFHIRTVIATRIPPSVQAALDWAIARWTELIATGAPPTPIAAGVNSQCSPPTPINETTADLILVVSMRPLNGGAAGAGGPCVIHGDQRPYATVLGQLTIDSTAIANFSDIGLRNLLLHEIGHALGSGTTSVIASYGLSTGIPGLDPACVGANAVREFRATPNGGNYLGPPVPLEPGSNITSAYAHWRSSVFPLEVMRTSVYTTQVMNLSRVTLGQLNDLGYVVRYDRADATTVNASGSIASFMVTRREANLDDDARLPEFSVNGHGRVRKLMPPPR